MRADTEAAVHANSSPDVDDPSTRAVNGKFTDDSEYFAAVTPVQTKLSKCADLQ